jgi:hypothetical protein
MKMEKGSSSLCRAIVSFLYETPNPIMKQRPPGHDTWVTVHYSFKPTKGGRISVSTAEQNPQGRNEWITPAEQNE